jgi:hypothetical protein
MLKGHKAPARGLGLQTSKVDRCMNLKRQSWVEDAKVASKCKRGETEEQAIVALAQRESKPLWSSRSAERLQGERRKGRRETIAF